MRKLESHEVTIRDCHKPVRLQAQACPASQLSKSSLALLQPALLRSFEKILMTLLHCLLSTLLALGNREMSKPLRTQPEPQPSSTTLFPIHPCVPPVALDPQ